ncbi:uncharacterized protein TM35_000411140 [Trypanosoma theileri]|uniref:EF-hand domain-containing protein n=1 Tax=Trypanosoma theileri TaxID=67003 RepID=A0A1X0NJ01_9TRYP|nr:uncharacterized protein TM35_000411140 [Trypanosoma theileri]ORC84744.1 hypothetical protein TM35_000411140 [Trypanosoma theileri]
MEEDLFTLIDRDFDGFLTLEETLQCFEHLGFIRDSESVKLIETEFSQFVGKRLDEFGFRKMVNILCAHCGVRLGSVWSVCVEQALYAAFTKSASKPEMTVPRSTMEFIQRSLVESGEEYTGDPSVFAANTPDHLDYGDFIEFFQLRWPHLSRAKVASLLLKLYPYQQQSNVIGVSKMTSSSTLNPSEEKDKDKEHAGPDEYPDMLSHDYVEALLKYATLLKATLRFREEQVKSAEELITQNAILRESLAVATEEHVRAQGQIQALTRELEVLTEERPVRSDAIAAIPQHDAAGREWDDTIDALSDNVKILSLVRRFCSQREEAEATRELAERAKEIQLERQQKFLLSWETALHNKESEMIQEQLETKRKWSEAFMLKEQQLRRLQENLELKELQLTVREKALAKRQQAQYELDRESNELSFAERRRRLQQLERIEATLRKREEQLKAREEAFLHSKQNVVEGEKNEGYKALSFA